MFCRYILNFIIRCQIAVHQGFIEYCQRGCLIGLRYLVKPNYHTCERYLWCAIFIIWSSFGFSTISYYLNNYSYNVYRIVAESHDRHQEFSYPTLGICETGVENDAETLMKVEQVLNRSLYYQFPSLRSNTDLRDFIHLMTFQNLDRFPNKKIAQFANYTSTLDPNIRHILENYNYQKLVKKVNSNCSEFFIKCAWLDTPFECCDAFEEIPTMLGKCFLFNSNQSFNFKANRKVKQIEIFREPFRLFANFSKPAKIFILSNKDIPETIAPLNRYELIDKGVTLSLEFNIIPIVNDESLLDLDPQILRCTQTNANSTERVYPFNSYTTCVTEHFFNEQRKSCQCKNLYYPQVVEHNFCNLSQYVCLEEKGFINPTSKISIKNNCLPTCEDGEFVIENAYYSETSSSDDETNAYTLDFVFLNFPTVHKRRQAIRQSEDKLVSFSGTLGLFVGLNVCNLLEFIFLTCCAFWKNKKTTMPQGVVVLATTQPEHKYIRPQVDNGRIKGGDTKCMLQP